MLWHCLGSKECPVFFKCINKDELCTWRLSWKFFNKQEPKNIWFDIKNSLNTLLPLLLRSSNCSSWCSNTHGSGTQENQPLYRNLFVVDMTKQVVQVCGVTLWALSGAGGCSWLMNGNKWAALALHRVEIISKISANKMFQNILASVGDCLIVNDRELIRDLWSSLSTFE